MPETWMARVERRLKALEEWQAEQNAKNVVRDSKIDECNTQLTALESYTRAGLDAAGEGLTALNLAINGAKADANEAKAAVAELAKRVENLEQPTPVDPPDPPPVIVVEGGPLVVRDEVADIDLGGRTIAGLSLEPYRVRSIVVRNGRIVRAPGDDAHAVDLRKMADGGTATLENVEIEAGGVDASCVYAPAIAKLTLRSVYARCKQTGTKDRHTRPANIHCDATAYVAEDCFIEGGNSGIYSRNYYSITRRSVIVVEQFATNGYALSSGGHYDCVWVPRGSGRGVLFERGDNLLQDCVGLAYDRPNDEFGSELDGPCVRVRYDGRVDISGGTYMSLGGGPFCNATALFLSNQSYRDNTIGGATFAAINLGGDRRARAVSLESQGTAERHSQDRIANCVFLGNQYLLSTTGSDNEAGCHQARALADCKWTWGASLATFVDATIATFVDATRAKCAEIGADHRAVAAIDEIAAGLLAIPQGTFAAERKTWLTGIYAGGDGTEYCELARPSGNATWTPADISASPRGGVRKLVIDGVEVYAPGSEQ